MNILLIIMIVSIAGAAITTVFALVSSKDKSQRNFVNNEVPACVAQHNFGVSANNRIVHKIYEKNAL